MYIMRFGEVSHFQTGMAVPVSSLHTELSCGVGEFADLVPFASWVKSLGMQIVQILPVNDTGEERSPYSARTAFGLNPVFIRLQDVEGSEDYVDEIAEARDRFCDLPRVAWLDVVRFKRSLMRRIFEGQKDRLAKDRELARWIQTSSWIKPYAVYCMLKEKNNEASWKDWKTYSKISASKIDSLWSKEWEETLFQAWMQWELEKQLTKVSKEIHEMGLKLKGDIPILINEDSADVWAWRKFFDLDRRAGAPPDMFSFTGQNWGFPTYNWDKLEKDNYGWWRQRLSHASRFYHSYRIDHVLGFFRIWTVPAWEETGIMGLFNPTRPLQVQELKEAGLPEQTLEYLQRPNFDLGWLRGLFGQDTNWVLERFFQQVWGTDDRFRLRNIIENEKTIIALSVEQSVKDALLKVYWNRVFVPAENDEELHPFWYWYDAPVLATLPKHEQDILREYIRKAEEQREDVWRATGLKLLKMMAEETDMLVCAEDLGAIPKCVPSVLEELEILGLRVERWTREWEKSGQPYIDPEQYPRLSVCTTSTHDAATLAGWWEESGTDTARYAQELGWAEVPDKMTPALAEAILRRLLLSNSLLAIFPIQDWLTVTGTYTPENPEDERVNIPATLDDTNWTWKLPASVSELAEDQELNNRILNLVQERTEKPLWNI